MENLLCDLSLHFAVILIRIQSKYIGWIGRVQRMIIF